jgi:hypothetical protein
MAKKAQGKTTKTTKTAKAKTATRAKTTTKAKTTKAATRGGKPVTTAKRAGGTPARSGRGVDRAKAAVKKPTIDPEVEAARARTRELWKSQAKESNAVELAKHGSLVDERARVRSTMGMSWSNRKPR